MISTAITSAFSFIHYEFSRFSIIENPIINDLVTYIFDNNSSISFVTTIGDNGRDITSTQQQ